MSRTTLNIDTPILRELRRLHERDGRSMGELASELMAEAMAMRGRRDIRPVDFEWHSQPMKPRIDLEDKEVLYAILDDDRDDSS